MSEWKSLNEESRQKWNSHYKKIKSQDINHDNWLEKHKSIFNENERILELGCGFGLNSLYLSALGHNVLHRRHDPTLFL